MISRSFTIGRAWWDSPSLRRPYCFFQPISSSGQAFTRIKDRRALGGSHSNSIRREFHFVSALISCCSVNPTYSRSSTTKLALQDPIMTLMDPNMALRRSTLASSGFSGEDTSSPIAKRTLLATLLHSTFCFGFEERASFGLGPILEPCTEPYCNFGKALYEHALYCDAGSECPTPFCVTAKWLMDHWIRCDKHQCHMCLWAARDNVFDGATPPISGSLVQYYDLIFGPSRQCSYCGERSTCHFYAKKVGTILRTPGELCMRALWGWRPELPAHFRPTPYREFPTDDPQSLGYARRRLLFEIRDHETSRHGPTRIVQPGPELRRFMETHRDGREVHRVHRVHRVYRVHRVHEVHEVFEEAVADFAFFPRTRGFEAEP